MSARDIQVGMTVYSSDDKKLGKVVSCEPDQFIVEKGFFFTKDYYVRNDEVADIREEQIRLALTADQLQQSSAGAETATTTGAGVGAGMEAPAEERYATTRAGTGTPTGTTEEVRVPLAEEELSAEKRVRQAGEVEIRKEVVTEQREISVPITREEVHVERVPASGEVAPGEASFQEGTVRVPVREEEVEIRKRPVVREEIRVSRTARQEERRASEEVRREEADVETRGDIPESGKPRES